MDIFGCRYESGVKELILKYLNSKIDIICVFVGVRVPDGSKYQVDCKAVDTFPSVKFTLEGKPITLDAKFYILKEGDKCVSVLKVET